MKARSTESSAPDQNKMVEPLVKARWFNRFFIHPDQVTVYDLTTRRASLPSCMQGRMQPGQDQEKIK